MSGSAHFNAAMSATMEQMARALEECSTWETRPHRTRWRRWLGQTETRRVVDGPAYIRRLGDLRQENRGPHGWEAALARNGANAWREAMTKRGPKP